MIAGRAPGTRHALLDCRRPPCCTTVARDLQFDRRTEARRTASLLSWVRYSGGYPDRAETRHQRRPDRLRLPNIEASLPALEFHRLCPSALARADLQGQRSIPVPSRLSVRRTEKQVQYFSFLVKVSQFLIHCAKFQVMCQNFTLCVTRQMDSEPKSEKPPSVKTNA